MSDRPDTEGGAMLTSVVPTLVQLFDAVGTEMFTVLAAPMGLERPVRSITLPDTVRGLGASVDSLHLATATQLRESDLKRVILASEEVSAAGLVLRRSACGTELLNFLHRHELVIMQIDDDVSWPTLFVALVTALGGLGKVNAAVEPDFETGDLFGLVNAIAGMLGGSTVVEDVNRRVLAYSTQPGQAIDDIREKGILDRRVPDFHGNDATYQAMWRSPRALRVESGYPNNRPRLCVAIRAGFEPLGSMWVVEGDQESVEDSLAALDRAAGIAAVHLLRIGEGKWPISGAHSRALLRVLGGEAALSDLRELGIKPHSFFGVIAYELVGDVTNITMERLAGIAQFTDANKEIVVSCAVIGDAVISLVSDDKLPTNERMRSIATAVAERSNTATGSEIRVVFKVVGDSLSAIPAAVRESEKALGLLAHRGELSGVVACDELEAALYLTELKDRCVDLRSVQAELIDKIGKYDAEHSSSYLETLCTYLRMSGDVANSAQELIIHKNTFRYRMSRLEQLFGIDLNDFDERLLLGLQIRLREI